MGNAYLNGEILAKKAGVPMWTMFNLQTSKFCSYDHKYHTQIFPNLCITPLGVACICKDGAGIFEINRSKEIFDGTGKIFNVYDRILPSSVRFNAEWLTELSNEAEIPVTVCPNGTVGAMEVPAMSFGEKIEREMPSFFKSENDDKLIDKEKVTEVILKAFNEVEGKKYQFSDYGEGWTTAVQFIADKLNIKY